MKKNFHCAGAALAFVMVTCAASAQHRDPKGGTLTLHFENDLFVGTDRYYTNGTKISWTSTDLSSFGESDYAAPLLPLINVTPFVNNPDFDKNLAFSIGQNIYTPDNTETAFPAKGDRPYAGWLYLETGLIWKKDDVRNSLVLNMGVVGSYSGAEETQRIVHDWRGFEHPKGWNNQLHNEFAFVASYERRWRLFHKLHHLGIGYDLLPFAGLQLGNVRIAADAGLQARFGLNIPDDFGVDTIGAGNTTPTPGRDTHQGPLFGFGFYGFARAEGDLVARDIFLDGNTFGHSVSVDKRPAVADLSWGVALTWKNVSVTYAFVHRTKEFRTQKGNGQNFGSITLNIPF